MRLCTNATKAPGGYYLIRPAAGSMRQRAALPSTKAKRAPVVNDLHTDTGRYRAERDKVQARIRRAPGWVGGYCIVWGKAGRWGIAIERRSLDASLHDPRIAVFRNHEDGPFAELRWGTLQVTPDPLGLWVEAALDSPELFRDVRTGCAVGLSPFVFVDERVGSRVTKARLGEISIIVPPGRPRLAGTWIDTGARAVARRDAELASYRKSHPYAV